MKGQELTTSGLVLFSHIVRSGSLSAAAEQLGIGRAAVSKQLSALEQRLDLRLLNRSTRSISMTEVGERIYREACKIEGVLESVGAIVDDSRNTLSGRLNVSCTHAVGLSHLVPLLPQFFSQYPGLHVNLQLEDRFVDMVTEKIDVSIRAGHLDDSSLIARRLGKLHWQLAASPEYLRINGTPTCPQDLLNHHCLCYRNSKVSMKKWVFDGPEGDEVVAVDGMLELNDANALVSAARQGLGVLLIDRSLIRSDIKSAALVPLLREYTALEGLPVYVVYPAREHLPNRTKVFVEFLQKNLSPAFS